MVSSPIIVVADRGTVKTYKIRHTPAHGAQFGIFMGIFFIASLLLQKNMYEAKPWQLWAIDAGYAIIGLVILGLLHGGWKKAPAAKT